MARSSKLNLGIEHEEPPFEYQWAALLDTRIVAVKKVLRRLRDRHDPTHQTAPPNHRCSVCEYVRHPCDTFVAVDEALDFLEGDHDDPR